MAVSQWVHTAQEEEQEEEGEEEGRPALEELV